MIVVTVPASSTVTLPISAVGIAFTTGIAFATTAAATYLDATAITAGDISYTIGYK